MIFFCKFTDTLKIATIIPIFKQGDAHNLKHYLPILVSFSKISENTVNANNITIFKITKHLVGEF